ncbi:MAG: eukaryotic-like serine/threonine-protein kinase [Actinomycetota bacterium]|jgi:serine/threonine protein kinase|nr:eukaryotic-like serine/threonine-protein kinase [Actinomycetota bacterium]
MAAECAVDQLLGGRYALVEALGHGASGVVWRARDQLLQRDVAVKEIRSPLVTGAGEGAAFRDAILREARAAARLNHPGAVTVYDVVEDDGRPLIVMELVDAPTLSELVETSGPRPPAEVAVIGSELLDALDAGHRAGIVHRDVKPGNVMVDGSGRVRLADFGVASVLDDVRMTTGSAVVGSPAYMAPEQVTGDDVGPPADLWALGATLYFAVEGRPPYDRGTAVPTMMAIVREPPRPPMKAGTLGPLLEALLTKDPAARPTAPFLRLWLAEVAGGPDTGPADDLDSTRQYPVAPTDVAVPPGPGGPMDPGPTGPDGPVVIPKPTPSEVPAPSPSPPTTPVPEPTIPTPEPERVPPAEPVPERMPPGPEPVPEPGPDPDPGRVPSEPDPLHVPSEPDPLVAPPAPPIAPRAARPARPAPPARLAAWVVGAVVALAAVALVGALLAGRGDGGGGGAAGGSGPTTASDAPTAVPADWVPYVDPSTGFTISHPPGWGVVVDGSLTDFRDPATGAYLRVDHIQPPGPSPEGAWLDYEPRFAAENAGYQRVRIEPTTFKGFPAAVWEYTYGGGLRAVDLGFVTGDYGFALNFQSREGDWTRLKPVFEAFQAGFRPPA